MQKLKKLGQKGFTLIELVVAIAIMLVIGAAVTPMLLGHLKDAKVASVNETLLNTKTAFDSYYVKKMVQKGAVDIAGDKDLLVDMLAEGLMGRKPAIQGLGDLKIAGFASGDETKFYLYAPVAANTDLDGVSAAWFTTLDKQIDDENPGAGTLQLKDGFENLATPIDAGISVFAYEIGVVKN